MYSNSSINRPKAYHPELTDCMNCSREKIRELLLQQWQELTPTELEATFYVKRRIARLIENKYGINSRLTENYLSNLERCLPLDA